MLQVAFAGSICLAAAFVFGAGKLHWPALVAGGCLLLGAIAYWSWRWRRSRHNSDNVWLDDDGLHWFDGSAAAGLSRRQVEGFRIGLDPDTVRAIPALTLILVGGFESQPVELHAPAAPSTVRDFLVQHWRLPEIEPSPARQQELLYRTVASALVERTAIGDAERLLLDCLIAPTLDEHRQWAVFQLPDECGVAFDPQACRFHVVADTGRGMTLEELVDYVDSSVLPENREAREEFLVRVESSAFQDRQFGELADARQIGFRWTDEHEARRWRFHGRPGSLLHFAERLARIAEQHQPPPPGARPALVRIGGLFHGISVEVNRYDGVAGDVLCATPDKLREISADVRSALEGAAADETIEVPVFLGGERWTLAFSIVADKNGGFA